MPRRRQRGNRRAAVGTKIPGLAAPCRAVRDLPCPRQARAGGGKQPVKNAHSASAAKRGRGCGRALISRRPRGRRCRHRDETLQHSARPLRRRANRSRSGCRDSRRRSSSASAGLSDAAGRSRRTAVAGIWDRRLFLERRQGTWRGMVRVMRAAEQDDTPRF